MDNTRRDIGAAPASSALLFAIVLASLWRPGIAAPLPSERPALLAQAAGADTVRIAQSAVGRDSTPQAPAAGTPASSAASKQVSVNVFLLSNQESSPADYIEAHGVRYIYFNAAGLVSPARPLAEPKPLYPQGALSQQDGAVVLQLLINEQGDLARIDVVCAAPPFESSARDSLRGMKFAPARDKNGPVNSYMLAEFGYGRGYPCARVPD